MAEVKGTCPDEFANLKNLFQQQLDSTNELGASIAVSIDGKEIIDLYGGWKSIDRDDPWEKDTIVNVWSSTKCFSALAVLMLIDQGKLDPFEKVSKYWPEFAQNGKENVEVRHFLSHSSGVSGWAEPVTADLVCDLVKSTEMLAKQAPWWEPGTASGYHSLNMGHLLGELVRRVSGKSLTQFIAEEIAGPVNADFQLGAPESDWSRIATLVPPPPPAWDLSAIPKDSVLAKTFFNPPMDATVALRPVWRKAEIGAANGHGNARSMNRIASIVTLGGTVNGKTFLSQKTIDLIFKEQTNGNDLVIGMPLSFGIGYGLPLKEGPTAWLPQKGRVCFWAGWGGSVVIMDLDRKLTLTYA